MASLLKPADVYVLIGLVAVPRPERWTQEAFGHDLGLCQAAVHRSMKRLRLHELVQADDYTIVRRDKAAQVLAWGMPWLHRSLGAPARGVPTAWSGPTLGPIIVAAQKCVWPTFAGVEGVTLEPLHAAVPAAALMHPQLYTLLSLVDAVCVGRARERSIAEDAIQRLLREESP